MTPLRPSVGESSSRGRPPPRKRPGGPGLLAVSLLVSALLHIAVVLLLPRFTVDLATNPRPPDPERPVDSPEDVELIRLVEVDPGAPEPPEPVPVQPVLEEEEPPEETAPTEEEPAGEEPEAEDATEEEVPTVAERLRPPEEGDARIWRPVDPELTELTPEDRALIRIYANLNALADSLFSEEERERRAREWVFTDSEGRRWGIGPGRIYLGDDSVSVPFSFSAPPSIENVRSDWRYDDAARAADVERIREVWEDRARAVRERREEERNGTSSGSGAAADSTPGG